MIRFLNRFVICAVAVCYFSTLVHAADRRIQVAKEPSGKRIALVIGNSSYASSPLTNPVNDARVMAKTLRRLGFEVMEATNLNYRSMNEAVETFGAKLRSGAVGLFYYAGHGMQVDGNNYMIPVDAKIRSENEIRFKSIDAGLVMAKMEQSKSEVNIIILDACRDNPFSRSFRSGSHGLAFMNATSGTFIAYATAPGKTAADGETGNGLYTSELVKVMETPGLPLEQVFKLTAKAVLNTSNGRQNPWTSSSLIRDFWFTPSGMSVVPIPSSDNPTVEKPNAGESELVDYRDIASPQTNQDFIDKTVSFKTMYLNEFTDINTLKMFSVKTDRQIFLNHRGTDYIAEMTGLGVSSDIAYSSFIISVGSEKRAFVRKLRRGDIVRVTGTVRFLNNKTDWFNIHVIATDIQNDY